VRSRNLKIYFILRIIDGRVCAKPMMCANKKINKNKLGKRQTHVRTAGGRGIKYVLISLSLVVVRRPNVHFTAGEIDFGGSERNDYGTRGPSSRRGNCIRVRD